MSSNRSKVCLVNTVYEWLEVAEVHSLAKAFFSRKSAFQLSRKFSIFRASNRNGTAWRYCFQGKQSGLEGRVLSEAWKRNYDRKPAWRRPSVLSSVFGERTNIQNLPKGDVAPTWRGSSSSSFFIFFHFEHLQWAPSNGGIRFEMLWGCAQAHMWKLWNWNFQFGRFWRVASVLKVCYTR